MVKYNVQDLADGLYTQICITGYYKPNEIICGRYRVVNTVGKVFTNINK